MSTNASVMKPYIDSSRGLSWIWGPSRFARHNHGLMPECEVGVQRNTRDFKGSVQTGYHVSDSHLLVSHCYTGFLGSNELNCAVPARCRTGEARLACQSLGGGGARLLNPLLPNGNYSYRIIKISFSKKKGSWKKFPMSAASMSQ